jgi:hypothetical protein
MACVAQGQDLASTPVNRLVWSTKTFDGKRPGVGKGGLAGHHFGQQAAGCGSERQAVVLVAEIEP